MQWTVANGAPFIMAKEPSIKSRTLAAVIAAGIALGLASPTLSASASEKNTIVREVSDFDTIRLSGKFNGTVVVGKSEGLELTGEGDLEKRVTAEVHGNELRVKLTRKGRRGDTIHVAVNTRELEEFIIEGAGKFEITGVDSDEFDIKLPGAASITVSGRCGELGISIAGAATVDAQHLICKEARVRISGTGTISLHASQSIDARVSGLGKIEVYGNPQEIDQRISGLGRIKLK